MLETYTSVPRVGVASVRDVLTSAYQLAREEHVRDLGPRDVVQFYAEFLLTRVTDESVELILLSDKPNSRTHAEIQNDLSEYVAQKVSDGWIRMPHVWGVDSIALELEIFHKTSLGI